MTEHLTIRLATTDDIPKLQELIVQSVSGLSTGFYSALQIASGLEFIFGVDTQLLKDETYFVAESGNQIVGAGGWSKHKTLFGGDQRKLDQPDPLLDPSQDAARIRAFYIHPKWSRRGIGTMILDACEHAALRSGFHLVELAATLPGVPFYLARGYQQHEEILITTPDGGSLPTIRMSRLL